MEKIFRFARKKSSYGRWLPYAMLSAIVVFFGWSDQDEGEEGKSITSFDYGKNSIVPTAFADTPTGSSGSSTSSTGCGGGDSNCGCGSGGDSGGSACNSGSGGCCFPGSAKVSTPEGEINISELKIGDTVISYDNDKAEFTTSAIVKVMMHSEFSNDAHDFTTNPLLKVNYEVNGQKQAVFVTSNHPVYSPESEEYKSAGEFSSGDRLLTQDGEVTIVGIETLEAKEYFQEGEEHTVFNLSVSDGPNTYIADGVIVHNKPGGGSDCY